jgi:hypothetical protein
MCSSENSKRCSGVSGAAPVVVPKSSGAASPTNAKRTQRTGSTGSTQRGAAGIFFCEFGEARGRDSGAPFLVVNMNKVLFGIALGLAASTWSSAAPAAEEAPGTVSSQEIAGTLVKFDLVSVPGGEANGVKIAPFKIGRTEVTWDEFDIYAFRLDLSQEQQADGVEASSRPSKPYGAPDRGFGHKGYPALAMTFHSAQEYCRWLSKKTGKKFRLPTEAEWEHAARANVLKPEALPAGEAEKVAWYWDTTEDKTQAVATKAPNAWGLHDTLGNVWEWCIAGAEVEKKDAPVVGIVRGGGYLSKLPTSTPERAPSKPPSGTRTTRRTPRASGGSRTPPSSASASSARIDETASTLL